MSKSCAWDAQIKRICLFSVCLALSVTGLAQSNEQHPATSSQNDLETQVSALRKALTETQQLLATQQREIEALEAHSDSILARSKSAAPGGNAASAASRSQSPGEPTAIAVISKREPQDSRRGTVESTASHEAPLGSFKLDNAVLALGGFVDLENIFRTTNTQNNIATAFGSIPYNNTPQGRVTELRTTAQFSRLSFKIADGFEKYNLIGYVEGDFSGNDAPNVYQTVNGTTNRLRLYFGDLRRNKWEFLGGQTWSWLTPNRIGIGPMPVDLALTYNEDQNLAVGIPYTRAPEFRVAYHPSTQWAFGVGIEDSNQFIGNFVALPAGFTGIGNQFDNGANAGAANLMPDILSKITYDHNFSDRHLHAELGGLLTGAHASTVMAGSTSFKSHTAIGGAGQIAASYELLPKLTVLANAYWSDGGAHYLVATGPELVVRPNSTGDDVSLSMVHAGAGSAGLEWRAASQDAFAVYYAGDYFERNFFPDTTNSAHPGSIIGFGGPGSQNTDNRAIQQITFDWIRTFLRNPRYGAFQFYSQYSYLTRAPWYVAQGNPRNAHLSMVYAGIRFVLPTSSGSLLRVPPPE